MINKKLLEKLEQLEQRTTAEPVEIWFTTVNAAGEVVDREHYMTIANGQTIMAGKKPEFNESHQNIDLHG